MSGQDSEHTQETVLLLLSGGADSTYLLHYYLLHTHLNIHAHYISMRFPHIRRWEKEDQAVSAIVDYCREHYRDFEFSHSVSEIGAWDIVGMDTNTQLTMASRIAPNLPGDLVTLVRGRCADDVLDDAQAEAMKTQQAKDLWQVLLRSITPVHRQRINPEYYCPLESSGVGKSDMIDDMPDDLLRLCWSCRVPVERDGELVPCGRCRTCLQYREILLDKKISQKFPNLFAALAK